MLEARFVHWTHKKHIVSTSIPGEGDPCAQSKDRLLSCSGSEPSTERAKILKGLKPAQGLKGIAGLHGKLLMLAWPQTALASSMNAEITQSLSQTSPYIPQFHKTTTC